MARDEEGEPSRTNGAFAALDLRFAGGTPALELYVAADAPGFPGRSSLANGEVSPRSLQTALNQLKREGIRLGTNKGRLANPEGMAMGVDRRRSVVCIGRGTTRLGVPEHLR